MIKTDRVLKDHVRGRLLRHLSPPSRSSISIISRIRRAETDANFQS